MFSFFKHSPSAWNASSCPRQMTNNVWSISSWPLSSPSTPSLDCDSHPRSWATGTPWPFVSLVSPVSKEKAELCRYNMDKSTVGEHPIWKRRNTCSTAVWKMNGGGHTGTAQLFHLPGRTVCWDTFWLVQNWFWGVAWVRLEQSRNRPIGHFERRWHRPQV